MTIWIIRHAQSRSNAGLPTIGPDDNGLSELGYLQAKCIPIAFKQAPDLIVTSPYVRTHLTAQPLIEQFAKAPTEVWQVQEFTYLSLPLDQPTTPLIRKPFSEAYWERCDPHYVDGVHAESFTQLMERVQTALQKMQQQAGFVVVFTHGLFIKAMLWQILVNPDVIDTIAMRRFHHFWQGFRVPNASILKTQFSSDGIPCWSSFLTDHLPPELQSSISEPTVAVQSTSAYEIMDAGDQPS